MVSHYTEINRYYFAILTKCFRRKHLATKGLLSLYSLSAKSQCHPERSKGSPHYPLALHAISLLTTLSARPVVVLSVCPHPHLVSWVSRSFGLSTTRQCHAELVEASPRSRPETTHITYCQRGDSSLRSE